MTYLNFSEALLDSFPDFREYYLSELKADEIDLLPSNITFAFIGFYDKQDLKANRSKVESIINFLEKMKYSGDEDLVMLYNETLTDISNFRNVAMAIEEIEKLQMVNPIHGLTNQDVSDKLERKKANAEHLGEKYVEQNRKLLAKYKNSN